MISVISGIGLGAAALIGVSGIRIVNQQERGIIERFGKYIRYAEPGFNWIIPVVDSIKKRDVREQTMDIKKQSVISKDNVELMIDAVVWYRVHPSTDNVKKSFYEIDDIRYAITKLCQTNIREIVGNMDFDTALVSREKIGSTLALTLDKLSDDWGVQVTKVEVQELDPPNDIKHAMHKQKTAEQDRRAMKLEATGRKEAALQDKEAKILLAEAERESAIRIAEGKRQSLILEAAGQAKAIQDVHTAAQKYFKGDAQALKKLEVTEESLKNNTKFMVPHGTDPVIVFGDSSGIVPLKKRN